MNEKKKPTREERAEQRRQDNDALDPRINPWLAELDDIGYITIPDFINAEELARIRHAFDTEVPLLPLPIKSLAAGSREVAYCHSCHAGMYLSKQVTGALPSVLVLVQSSGSLRGP